MAANAARARASAAAFNVGIGGAVALCVLNLLKLGGVALNSGWAEPVAVFAGIPAGFCLWWGFGAVHRWTGAALAIWVVVASFLSIIAPFIGTAIALAGLGAKGLAVQLFLVSLLLQATAAALAGILVLRLKAQVGNTVAMWGGGCLFGSAAFWVVIPLAEFGGVYLPDGIFMVATLVQATSFALLGAVFVRLRTDARKVSLLQEGVPAS